MKIAVTNVPSVRRTPPVSWVRACAMLAGFQTTTDTVGQAPKGRDERSIFFETPLFRLFCSLLLTFLFSLRF